MLYLSDPDVTLHHGDVLATLRELPAESVDCVVTSPPYWGLRDYGQEGQLGLEPTPEQYVERMVEVFREVRRVLAAHGTVWLNLGDSYYAAGWESRRRNEVGAGSFAPEDRRSHTGVVDGLKVKDLVGIPWRVAFALQADGWYLRSDIIWSKPNPMPESVTDRPTKAHEYVFLLSKQPRYFFDQEAVRERWEEGWKGRLDGSPASNGRLGGPGGFKAKGPDGRAKTTVQGADGSIQHRDGERWPNGGRNIRSVWDIATQPYPEAHFATFPEELARRCIAAGCPEQVCRVCGKARERIVDSQSQNSDKRRQQGIAEAAARGIARNRAMKDSLKPPLVLTTGFTECRCLLSRGVTDRSVTDTRRSSPLESKYRPGIVLDPFVGSGTVAYVARKLGRHAVGIDLNESYLDLAARRLQQQSLFAEAVGGA